MVGNYHALVVRGRTKVTPEVFAAAPNLKIVGRAGVGVDNINLEAAKSHGVAVVNAPVSTTLAVAELTIGMLLSTARMIPRADSSMKQGQWIKKQLEGVELCGKHLGIIGMGNIGCAVARQANGLGMTILGYDKVPWADEFVACSCESVPFDELLARSDFITLHIPLTDETRNMINREAIAKMRPGVRLVCTARGGIVDEAALLEALNTGQVAAAALDVFAKEPPGLTELVSHPNMVCTPHVGAQTAEAQTRASVDIANEVLTGLADKPLRWRVA
jgi:D-3-phosphoglycerate dehydrogenase